MTLRSDRLSLNPSRAADKPDDLGTLKNFLSFSIIFYKTRLILSTVQDWWEIKHIMEPQALRTCPFFL